LSDEQNIRKIVAALETTLAELEIAEHTDVLNALTEILIETLKTNEYLTESQAYMRIVACFTSAAGKETSRPTSKLPAATKFQKFQMRQQRVAQRAAKAAQQNES